MMGGMKVSISLPDELGARLDAFRGDVPRSVFVRRAVERALGDVAPVTDAGSKGAHASVSVGKSAPELSAPAEQPVDAREMARRRGLAFRNRRPPA